MQRSIWHFYAKKKCANITEIFDKLWQYLISSIEIQQILWNKKKSIIFAIFHDPNEVFRINFQQKQLKNGKEKNKSINFPLDPPLSLIILDDYTAFSINNANKRDSVDRQSVEESIKK